MRKEKTVFQALAFFFSLGAPGKSKERYAILRRDWAYNLIYDSDVQAVSKKSPPTIKARARLHNAPSSQDSQDKRMRIRPFSLP